MQLAAINAMYDSQHKDRPYHDGTFRIWMKERSAVTPFHAREGVSLWLSPHDLTPDDDFLGQKRQTNVLGSVAPVSDVAHDEEQSEGGAE